LTVSENRTVQNAFLETGPIADLEDEKAAATTKEHSFD
jgi:hypothetical protein